MRSRLSTDYHVGAGQEGTSERRYVPTHTFEEDTEEQTRHKMTGTNTSEKKPRETKGEKFEQTQQILTYTHSNKDPMWDTTQATR